MAKIIDGKQIAKEVRAEIAAECAKLKKKGIIPGLAVVIVGTDPASQVYVRNKHKSCGEVGIESEVITMPEQTTQQELLEVVERLNQDETVDGILVQLPLPKQIDEKTVLRSILPEKDVDGAAEGSLAAVYAGTDEGFAPCTAEACLHLLRAYGFDPAGRRVTVVGRSLVIGRPAALLLTRADATVTLCHRKTPDLAARCREADILLAAAGAPGLITPACVHPGQIVLDAGVTALPDGTLLGDVAAEAAGTVAACTPVPGGVGSVTTALLLLHTVQSAEIFRQF